MLKDKIRRVKLADLNPAKYNPNEMDVSKRRLLKQSLQHYGYIENIIANQDLTIIDGHHRVEELLDQGIREEDVVILDLTKDEEKALNLALRRIKGTADPTLELQLVEELTLEGFDLELAGFDLEDLQELSLAGEQKQAEEDDFDPETVTETICQKGDLWQLGKHTLLCGDAYTDINKLIGNEFIELLLTDPPYGIDIVNGTNADISAKTGFVGTEGIVKARKYKTIINDDKDFNPQFMLEIARKSIIWGANNFASKLNDNSHWIVWDKKAEKGADHNNFSDVELAWTNIDRKSCVIYRHLWSGLLREGDRDIELQERVHPTQKPVGLMGEIINDYSKTNDNILDLFGGSGSTLIACEQLDRNCFMMELDPHYCDVIIHRWEDFTGEQAEKIS